MKFFAPATNTPSVTSSELDAMRAELEAMRQELAAMRAEQGVVTPGGVQLRQKSRILMKDASDHTMKRESSHWTVALEPSCWTIPLVVDEHSRAATALLVLLFLANLALQLIFCFVVYWKLGASTGEEKKNIYGEQTVHELIEWRRSIAHDARFYKRATQRSMAQRVCDGDAGLESSTSQQERYESLSAYLGAVGEPRTNFGPWMATACLVAFVLTMVKEWRATLRLGVAVVGLEAGPRTELVVGADGGDDGTLSLLRISHARRGLALAALAARSFIAAVLLWYGCRWLVNTIDLAELILNAVALEFVISVDELVFDALVPARVKSRLESIRPLQVKTAGRKNVVGHVDLWSLGTLVFVVGFVLTICLTLLATQTDVLVRSRDAICGGDQDFVHTTDGAGIPAWGYPGGVDPTATRDVGFSGLANDQDNSDFATRAIDAVLDQHGRAASCEPEDCYTLPDTAAGGLRYVRADRPDCCLARLLEVPNVDSGEFSVLRKSTETISEAVALSNPICYVCDCVETNQCVGC